MNIYRNFAKKSGFFEYFISVSEGFQKNLQQIVQWVNNIAKLNAQSFNVTEYKGINPFILSTTIDLLI